MTHNKRSENKYNLTLPALPRFLFNLQDGAELPNFYSK